MNKAQTTDNPIQKYINETSLRLTNEQKKLIERTSKLQNSMMLGSTDEIQLFQLILKSIKAKKVIEVGTFTGYSSMTMALALPDDGQVITLDITDEVVAKDIWKEAGVDHKIKLEIGSAVDSLKNLLAQGQANAFDFAFIDADKENYMEYYELCLQLIRPNGIIAIDNVLWSGRVIDQNDQTLNTKVLRNVAQHVKNDQRVDISMLSVGDGLLLCLKK